jgi:hypothetical protein
LRSAGDSIHRQHRFEEFPMTKMLRRSRGLAFAGALVVTGACAPMDTVFGDVGMPASARTISGEVRSLDARRGRMQVREDYGNRTHTIRFDNRTRVVHNQRTYSPTALERGDYVRVSISHDRSGDAWADRIDVRSSARDSRGRDGRDSRVVRTERVDGTVRNVDTRRGYFMVEYQRGRMMTVQVPRGISSSDARRFDRLRRGDRVRADVRVHGNDFRNVELIRFR